MQMNRTMRIDDEKLTFKRSIAGWVGVLGPSYIVYFRQPIPGGVWVARKPGALEPIATASTLTEVVRKAKVHHLAWMQDMVNLGHTWVLDAA